MSDNVNIRDFGNNSVPVASDQVSGVQFQVVKVAYGAQDSVTYASSASPLPVSAIGALTINDLQNPPPAGLESDFSPTYSSNSNVPTYARFDPDGNTKIRGPILTDEGSYRTNFPNSSLAINIGNLTFTSGSNTVTGSGITSTINDMHKGCYVYKTSDGPSFALQVINYNDTAIVLEGPYQGTTGNGPASRQILNSKIAAGITISVTNGQAVASMGTTSGSAFELERDVDILPLIKQTDLSISQRILNQTTQLGFYDDTGAASASRYYAWFVLDGTDSTKVRCESSRNPITAPTGNEIQATTVTVPNSKTTAQSMRYKVELLFDRANFWLDGNLVAQHFVCLPLPDDLLTSSLRCTNNAATTSSTIINVNYDSCRNYNVVDTFNGQDTVTTTTPTPVGGDLLNELAQTLETLAQTIQALGGLAEAKDPTTARIRMTLDNIASNLTLTTVTTVASVTNQSQVGGIGAIDHIPSLMNMVAQNMIMNGVVVS